MKDSNSEENYRIFSELNIKFGILKNIFSRKISQLKMRKISSLVLKMEKTNYISDISSLLFPPRPSNPPTPTPEPDSSSHPVWIVYC